LPHPVAYLTTSNVFTRYISVLFCELLVSIFSPVVSPAYAF
jgi:hypothetical protein